MVLNRKIEPIISISTTTLNSKRTCSFQFEIQLKPIEQIRNTRQLRSKSKHSLLVEFEMSMYDANAIKLCLFTRSQASYSLLSQSTIQPSLYIFFQSKCLCDQLWSLLIDRNILQATATLMASKPKKSTCTALLQFHVFFFVFY